MHAASYVISRAIKSVYPTWIHLLKFLIAFLNQENWKQNTQCTLWSSMTFRKGYWETNHFVPLLKPVEDIIDITDEFPPLSPITSPRRQSTESTPASPLSFIQFSTAVDHCYSQNIVHCSTYDSLPSLDNTESPRQSASEENFTINQDNSLPSLNNSESPQKSSTEINCPNDEHQDDSHESLENTGSQMQDLSSTDISSPSMDDANDVSASDMVLETPFSNSFCKLLHFELLLLNQMFSCIFPCFVF